MRRHQHYQHHHHHHHHHRKHYHYHHEKITIITTITVTKITIATIITSISVDWCIDSSSIDKDNQRVMHDELNPANQILLSSRHFHFHYHFKLLKLLHYIGTFPMIGKFIETLVPMSPKIILSWWHHKIKFILM